MIEYVLIAAVLAVGIIVMATSRQKAVRRRRREFSDREPLSIDSWLSINEQADDSAVEAVLHIFGRDLDIPIDRLYPSDRFDKELKLKGLFLIDEVVSDDLLNAVRDRFDNVKWNDKWETVAEAAFGLAMQVHFGSDSAQANKGEGAIKWDRGNFEEEQGCTPERSDGD